MAFCSNCGTKLKDGSKFCAECGASQAAVQTQADPPPQVAASQPRTVHVGQVKKCPNCGAPIESFQTRCPSCSYELNSIEVSSPVKEFATQLLNLEAANTGIKRGNIRLLVLSFSLFIGSTFPLYHAFYNWVSVFQFDGWLPIVLPQALFYTVFSFLFILPALGMVILPKPKMTNAEKQKQSLVENYVIPNTREALLEFCTFAVSQLEDVKFIASLFSVEKKYIQLWNTIWKKKCKQAYAKASIALALDDPAAFSSIKKMLHEANII
jgi:uncharacterized Zn finger protein (UPF0148 family)